MNFFNDTQRRKGDEGSEGITKTLAAAPETSEVCSRVSVTFSDASEGAATTSAIPSEPSDDTAEVLATLPEPSGAFPPPETIISNE